MKRPATVHALRPEQMISDPFALNTKVSEIQDMLQELISTGMLTKLENNAIKYVSGTVLNLSRALHIVNEELKLVSSHISTTVESKEEVVEKDVSQKIIQELTEENEMIQQRLREAEEKCDQLTRVKEFLGRQLLSPSPSLGRLTAQFPQAPIEKKADAEEIDNLLSKELEEIMDDSQKKGTRGAAVTWDSSVTYVAQGEVTLSATRQQAETTLDEIKPKALPSAETLDADLERERAEQIKASQLAFLQALQKKKDRKPKGPDTKGGRATLWDRVKKGKAEQLVTKVPVKQESTVETTDKEAKSETELPKRSQPESTPGPHKTETKWKKLLSGKPEEKKQLGKLQPKTPKETSVGPEKSEQTDLESFQRAILAFLREKTNNVGKAFDPKSIQEEEGSLARAEVEKLDIIRTHMDEYFQKVADDVTKTLRTYKDAKREQFREKFGKQPKVSPAMPQPSPKETVATPKWEMSKLILSEITDPPIRKLVQALIEEVESERDPKASRQELQRQEEEVWKEEPSPQKPRRTEGVQQLKQPARSQRVREEAYKEKQMPARDAEEGGEKQETKPKPLEKLKLLDLSKVFGQAPVGLSAKWMKLQKAQQTGGAQVFQADSDGKEPRPPPTSVLVAEKPLPMPGPEQAQLTDPAMLPVARAPFTPEQAEQPQISGVGPTQKTAVPLKPAQVKDVTLISQQALGLTLTTQLPQPQETTLAQTKQIAITLEEAEALGLTLTPEQIKAQGIILTPQQAEALGRTLTLEQAKTQWVSVIPQQAEALDLTLTPEQVKAQEITLTPQQAKALGLTLTPEQVKAQGITLTPQQAEALGLTLTPEQVKAQGLTLTPQQAEALGLTLILEQAKTQRVSVTPQQAEPLGLTLTPEQVKAQGLTLTPQQAEALELTLTLEQAKTQRVSITPQQVEALGLTFTPEQAQAQAISLSPQQAQTLGLTPTPQQAHIEKIYPTPQQAQALGITLTPEQAKAQISLTPQQASALNLTLTPEQAQALGIAPTPQPEALKITLTPEQAKAQKISLTPQQAQTLDLTLTPEQAQVLGIAPTPQPEALKITFAPEQAQVLGIAPALLPEADVITFMPELAQALRISPTPKQIQTLGITPTPRHAKVEMISPTPEQAQALGVKLMPEQARALVSLSPEQAQALGVKLAPEQARAQVSLSPEQAQALGVKLTPEQARALVSLSPEQAQALGVKLTPGQARALVSLSPEQAQALGVKLAPEQARAPRTILSPEQGQALGITLTPEQAKALGISPTLPQGQLQDILPPQKSQGLDVPLTPQQAAALRSRLTMEQLQTPEIPIIPESIQTPKPAVGSKQIQAIESSLATQQPQMFGVPFAQRQDLALGTTPTPGQPHAFEQVQALQPPVTRGQAPLLQGQFAPRYTRTLTFTITLEKAQNLGVTLTREQMQAAAVTFTTEQVAALEDALTAELAWKWGDLFTLEKAQEASQIIAAQQPQGPEVTAPFTDRLWKEFPPTSIPLEKFPSSPTYAPLIPRTGLRQRILSDSEKLEEEPWISPTYRQILEGRGQVIPAQPLTPPPLRQLPTPGAPPTPGPPLGPGHFFRPGDTQPPLSETAFGPKQPPVSAVLPFSEERPERLVSGASASTIRKEPWISRFFPFQPPAALEHTPYSGQRMPYSVSAQQEPSWASPEQPIPFIISPKSHPSMAEAPPIPGRPQGVSPFSVIRKTPGAESARAHPGAALDLKVSQAPFPTEMIQTPKVSDTSGQTRLLQDSFDGKPLGKFQPYITSYKISGAHYPHVDEKALSRQEKPLTSLPSLTTQPFQMQEALPSQRGPEPQLPAIDKPWIPTPVSGARKAKMMGSPFTDQHPEDRYYINVEAQRKNLVILNQAAQMSGLPSQYHTMARNLIVELLHMNAVRLGYLCRKYIARRLIQSAR